MEGQSDSLSATTSSRDVLQHYLCRCTPVRVHTRPDVLLPGRPPQKRRPSPSPTARTMARPSAPVTWRLCTTTGGARPPRAPLCFSCSRFFAAGQHPSMTKPSFGVTKIQHSPQEITRRSRGKDRIPTPTPPVADPLFARLPRDELARARSRRRRSRLPTRKDVVRHDPGPHRTLRRRDSAEQRRIDPGHTTSVRDRASDDRCGLCDCPPTTDNADLAALPTPTQSTQADSPKIAILGIS